MVFRGHLRQLSGLRDRDLAAMLYAKPAATKVEQRRRSARMTRLIRWLRGHGSLHKVPKSQRYQVSEEGRQSVTALLAAANANIEALIRNAA